MGPVYSYIQMLLYYPPLLLIFYIYAVFVIPSRSGVFRREYWSSIKTSFERSDIGHIFRRSDIGHIFMSAIKKWKGGGK